MATSCLVILCGLSFAGKSSAAKVLAKLIPAQIVSLDEINRERGLDGGGGIPVEEWITTNAIAREQAEDLLSAGMSVVLDDTTSLRTLRDGWRSLATGYGAVSALVWVQIDPGLQRQRLLSNRESEMRGDVVDSVMKAHISAFEPPSDDEGPIIVAASDARDARALTAVVSAIAQRFAVGRMGLEPMTDGL